MRFLFCTQAESVRLFDTLYRKLAQPLRIERAGFIVADSLVYSRWLAECPDFERRDVLILKEWEVTAARDHTVDLAALAQYERKLGAASGLFGAIVADRRLFMGPDCTYSQDYRRRFRDAELASILLQALRRMESLFDELRPQVLVGFICVTMLDYIAYLFARARGVQVLNLRPTRVGDYVAAASILNDPSPELAARYAELGSGVPSMRLAEAKAHIERVRYEHGRYEGVIGPSDRPALQLNAARSSVVKRVVASLANYRSYRRVARADNHVPNPLRALWFAGLINPRRARQARALLASKFVRPETLAGVRYVFYPLHTEPEVSLLVYGRPYVNQIEVIRWLAMSLPVDCVLVVKEHPWMVGKRTLGAYRKMLNIPRVHFADPRIEARVLVQGCQLVAVITGSVALEAAILGKPVLTFGDCPYNLLPPHMLRRCDDPRRLPVILRQLLDEHRADDEALARYIAAVMDSGVRLNLYSVLLGKKNVHVERASEYGAEIDKLAAYIGTVVAAPAAPLNAPGAAAW